MASQWQAGNEPPSLSSEALVRGRDSAAAGAEVVVESGHRSTLQSTPSLGTSMSAARPRRSWDTAFSPSSNGGGGGYNSGRASSDSSKTGAGTNVAFRPMPASSLAVSAAPAEVTTSSAAAVATDYGRTFFSTEGAALRRAEDMTSPSALNAKPHDRKNGSSTDDDDHFGRSSKVGTTEAIRSFPPDTRDAPTPASARAGGAGGSDDDLTDTDEGVMARLAEFTEIARRTAVHNEELCRELAAKKRRVAQTARKLEQSNMTSMELRESLALAQDTVMRLREHEMAWAERTASEMSLRSEMCALKDDLSRVSGDNTALKKRCDILRQENTELGERFAAIAEEKRQVESKARRLLRSDRYRGY